MSISSNFPALKPSLLLDFANVKALDPGITFTRTTTATYYDGKTTAKAEENLVLHSADFTNAVWVNANTSDSANTEAAPDGTTTADTITATAANGTILQTFTAVAGSYTFSVFLKRKTGTGDIQIAADSGTWTTKTITANWARYDVTQTLTAGSKTAGIRIVTDTDEVYAWGAQLEQRSAVTAYTPTTTQPITNYIPVLQTAASGVARFDHNPTTGESLGLLVEEQRTNLLTYSAEFDDAAWTKSNSSITANTIVAPDGTLTGDKLVEDTSASTTHQLQRSSSVTSGTSYTYSIYAKAAERSGIRISGGAAAFGSNEILFNLSAGTVTVTSGTPTGSIVSVGNGWYRCSWTAAATTTTTPNFFVYLDGGSGISYTGDGYSGIYIWGAQLEAGAFPTSYIPTTSATVTRNADAATMTGTNFSSWYRADEGTLYAESSVLSPSGTQKIVNVDAGAGFANSIDWYYSSGSPRFDGYINSAGQWGITPAGGAVTANTFTKLSGTYKVNDIAAARNAGTVLTDTTALIPSGVSRLVIGSSNLIVQFLNGHIRKLAYYPSRLSNAQLQALTT